MLVPLSVASAKEKPLIFDITYTFAGHPDLPDPGYVCDLPRGLAWVGDVKGAAFDGVIYYCMHAPDDPDHTRLTGITNHWEDAVFEIYDGDTLVLRGEEAGSTTMLPPGAKKTANWRAMGVITYAAGIFEDWDDHPFHERGDVYGIVPSWTGGSKIVIH